MKKDGGVDCLVRCLAGIPDKQAAALIATASRRAETQLYFERVMGHGVASISGCKRADSGVHK